MEKRSISQKPDLTELQCVEPPKVTIFQKEKNKKLIFTPIPSFYHRSFPAIAPVTV